MDVQHLSIASHWTQVNPPSRTALNASLFPRQQPVCQTSGHSLLKILEKMETKPIKSYRFREYWFRLLLRRLDRCHAPWERYLDDVNGSHITNIFSRHFLRKLQVGLEPHKPISCTVWYHWNMFQGLQPISSSGATSIIAFEVLRNLRNTFLASSNFLRNFESWSSF